MTSIMTGHIRARVTGGSGKAGGFADANGQTIGKLSLAAATRTPATACEERNGSQYDAGLSALRIR